MGLASKTLIVAPYGKSVPLYKEALKKQGLDIDIITVSDEAAAGGKRDILKRIKRFVESGKEIIIARGTIANQIREYGIHVVELEVTDYDVLQVIKKYIEYRDPIAVIECQSFTRKVERIAGLWGLDVDITTTSTIADLHRNILQAARTGYKVVISGAWGEYNSDRLAPYDITYEMVGCSNQSILDSVERAFAMYSMLQEEKRQKEILSTVVNFSLSGLVGVDRNGIVNVFNSAAEGQLGMAASSIIGRPVDKVLPQLHLVETLDKRIPETNKIMTFGEHKLVVTNVPLLVDSELTGAVSTFQKLRDVEEGERKIRSQMAEKGLSAKYTFANIIGRSKKIQDTVRMAQRFCQIDSTILLTGESGTGKEVFAQSIHNASPRRDNPFVAVNCSALPGTLLESELFGYADGAFTGARKGGKIGIFELAHKGTIFLDEIGEIDKGMQVQLLRVLQEKEVRRIGDDKVIPIDVRVVAATNKDLYDEVLKGNFRDDLFFRLSVLNIHLSSLRERKEDIPLLTDFIISGLNQRLKCNVTELDSRIAEIFQRYDWPGNVRELQSTLEKIVVITQVGQARYTQVSQILDELAFRVTKRKPEYRAQTLNDLEKKAIIDALKEEGGNRTYAARRLGVDRSTLFRKMKNYEIQ